MFEKQYAYEQRINEMEERLESPVDAPSRPYRAVFFDLDGTLLPMELNGFIDSYFKAIARFVGARGFDQTVFLSGFKAGIAAMATHDDGRTNRDVYWEAFFQQVDRTIVDWEAMLSGFYENDFGEVGDGVVPNPAAVRAVSTLVGKGYPLVLATMPMFPRRAVEWRLSWAGIDPGCFMRLTSYENSTSVKPKLDYYAENLAACGISGGDVLMVGNNTVEDLSALGVGADAFLVTDHLLDPVGYDMRAVKHGTMEEFAGWVESFPVCADPARDIEPGVVDAPSREAALGKNTVGAEGTDETVEHAEPSLPRDGDGSVSASTAEVMAGALGRAAADEKADA